MFKNQLHNYKTKLLVQYKTPQTAKLKIPCLYTKVQGCNHGPGSTQRSSQCYFSLVLIYFSMFLSQCIGKSLMNNSLNS